MTDAERFQAKIGIDQATGCWVWLGARDQKGYGKFQFRGTTHRAHRVALILAGRRIPDDLQVDHLCRNRACVNPDHLELVTCRENLMRGETRAAHEAAATHCRHGHPFDVANTYHWRGHRVCRACNNAVSRRKRAKARAK